MITEVKVPAQLFDAVQNYLVTKPFNEVAQLVTGMTQALQAARTQGMKVEKEVKDDKSPSKKP